MNPTCATVKPSAAVTSVPEVTPRTLKLRSRLTYVLAQNGSGGMERRPLPLRRQVARSIVGATTAVFSRAGLRLPPLLF
jgi:hypothetical protein